MKEILDRSSRTGLWRTRSARVTFISAAVGFLILWPVYGGLYRHGGGGPLSVENVTSQVDSPRFAEAETRVFETGEETLRHLRSRDAGNVILERGDQRYVLIAVGPRSSTGYRLRLENAVEERGRILIEVRELTPGVSDRVDPRVTYPFLLLEIPAGDKPVRVELAGRP